MPHFVIDCSESVLNLAEPDEILRTVYESAESTELFAASGVGGIKARLNPYRHYLNVESREHFVHVFANIMQGRTEEQKKRLSHCIVSRLKSLLPTVEIISVNVRDFEKATYCNATMVEAGAEVGDP